MKEYVKNPQTKRWIVVGGKTYNEVAKTHPSIKKSKRYPKPPENATMGKKNNPIYPRARPTSLEKELETVPKTRRALREHGKDLKESKRMSHTRGWSLAAPQRGRERKMLKDKCGNSCFLLPEQQKFPICKSLRTSEGRCEVDCRGLAAAKIRANQHGYTKIAKDVERLQRIYGC